MNIGRHRTTGVERRLRLAHVTGIFLAVSAVAGHPRICLRQRLVCAVAGHLARLGVLGVTWRIRRLGVIPHRRIAVIAFHLRRFGVIAFHLWRLGVIAFHLWRLGVMAVITHRFGFTVAAHGVWIAVITHRIMPGEIAYRLDLAVARVDRAVLLRQVRVIAILVRRFGVIAVVVWRFRVLAILVRRFRVIAVVVRRFRVIAVVVRRFRVIAVMVRRFRVIAVVIRRFGVITHSWRRSIESHKSDSLIGV